MDCRVKTRLRIVCQDVLILWGHRRALTQDRKKDTGYTKGRVEPAMLNRPPLLRRVSVFLRGELRSPHSDDQGLKDRFSKAAICTDVVFARKVHRDIVFLICDGVRDFGMQIVRSRECEGGAKELP